MAALISLAYRRGNSLGSSPRWRAPSRIFLVAKIGQVRIVELDIRAARGAQALQFRCIGRGDIGVELLEIRVGIAADRIASAAEVQHRRGRNGHLWRLRGHGLQESKSAR
jgi:hypothetical protein